MAPIRKGGVSNVGIAFLAMFLPQRLKRSIYVHGFGWHISESAHIGFSFLHGTHYELGERCYIGHGNIFKELQLCQLGPDVYIKNFNSFFAQNMPVFPDRKLRIAEDTKIMSRHFFDVSGTISIGARTIVGGRDSQFWSHSEVREAGARRLKPRSLHIGDDVYIGARVTLVHALIPDRCIVAAGAVAVKTYEGTDLFVRGNPATASPIEPVH